MGSDSKGEILKNQLGFNTVVNYKDPNYRQSLKEATEPGVDVYFDNTGGMILGSALFRMNVGGRIACCGVVSQYDTNSPEPGPKGIPGLLVNKRLEMKGFVVFDFEDRYEEARSEISGWMDSGKLISLVDGVSGLDAAPDAFVDLLAGGNIGTVLFAYHLIKFTAKTWHLLGCCALARRFSNSRFLFLFADGELVLLSTGL